MGDMTEPDKILTSLAGAIGFGPEGITARKFSTVVPVSRDFAIDHGLIQPTTAERQERERWHADYEARKQAATEAWPVFVAALNAVTDPVGRAVLDQHKADEDGRCRGCDFDGYEAEPPNWPCPTTILIATTLGIPVSEDLHMAEQARQW